MGTGITSILVHDLPYNAGWLRRLGDVIFVVNIVVFILLAMGNVVRYARFKGLFASVNNHLVSGMFWGCLPMGFATIVNMVAIVCVPAWGHHWAQTALGLWWIDVVLSILVNFGMIFMMFTRHDHTIETISAAWLLPIVSSVVAAASGGVVSTALAPFDPALARSTVIVSYVVWGTGVPLAMFIITLWIYRSALSGTPTSGAFCSVFLPLGPCGQGSFGIMTLSNVVRTLAYTYDVGLTVTPEGVSCSTSIQRVADAVYAGGMVTGMVLWGLGLCWYILAFAMVLDHVLKNRDFFFLSKFSVGFWAITFPIGVFATATTTLASELHSPAFKVIGTILSVQVALHWLAEKASALLDCWYNLGGRRLDTAAQYGATPEYGAGGSERRLQEAGAGEIFVNDTKVSDSWVHERAFAGENIRKSLDISLVDILFLHHPNRVTPHEHFLKELDTLYREGKFAQLGISNHTAEETDHLCQVNQSPTRLPQVADANGWIKPSIYQGNYSALSRTSESHLFPHSALRSDMCDGVILGASSLRQLEETVQAFAGGPLGEKEVRGFEEMWEMCKEV
ncbi:transporter [Saitozyma podzolica]|uniref:Transporter n=1 Tax=Saitozyma podzolica TaxID=1890683 RepID=A0A427XPQ1_9TREE|nr:transporter [Saitozyma podzolica]